jgi:hypothetical protein
MTTPSSDTIAQLPSPRSWLIASIAGLFCFFQLVLQSLPSMIRARIACGFSLIVVRQRALNRTGSRPFHPARHSRHPRHSDSPKARISTSSSAVQILHGDLISEHAGIVKPRQPIRSRRLSAPNAADGFVAIPSSVRSSAAAVGSRRSSVIGGPLPWGSALARAGRRGGCPRSRKVVLPWFLHAARAPGHHHRHRARAWRRNGVRLPCTRGPSFDSEFPRPASTVKPVGSVRSSTTRSLSALFKVR